MTKYLFPFFAFSMLITLTACETVPEPEKPIVVKQQPVKKAKPVVKKLSAAPIIKPRKSDILFAQRSLKALGYPIGRVDGVWGKRSAAAIIEFEKQKYIQSANGQLSELNLAILRSNHPPALRRSSRLSSSVKKSTTGIASKLSSQKPTPEEPELVIVDKAYAILLKPNPFSEVVANIESGEGIYIMSLQGGWYEVETLSNHRGFIQKK